MKLEQLFSPDEIRKIKSNVSEVEKSLNDTIKKLELREGSFDDI